MSEALRVLTPLHSFEPGGVERVALRLNAAWQAAGVDARVVMGRGDGAMTELAAEVDHAVLTQPPFSTAAWETLWLVARLPAVIRRHRPDVLFCAGNTYAVVMLAMRLLLGRACPPIVAKVSNDLARLDLPPLARWSYRRWLRLQGRFIDAFVGMAEPMRDEIADAMGIDTTRVTIVEDGVLTRDEVYALAQAPRPADPTACHYFAAGRLVPQKNFALLLQAFARVAGPRDRLTIVGEGPLRGSLEALVRSLGISDRVALPGHRSAISADLAAADVFVLSSDYEGVPAVVVEALASGRPIVATTCSVSMEQLLGGGRYGILTRVGDLDAFAAALVAIRDKSFNDVAARASAARFTVERAARRYHDYFNDIAGASRGTSRPAHVRRASRAVAW